MKQLTKLLLLLSLITSCASNSNNPQSPFLVSTLYAQHAAEYKALSLQAYNIAYEKLKSIKKNRHKKAIILDVDETVLDNSPYQGRLYFDKQTYNGKNWDKWIEQQSAKPIEGALDFTWKAKKMGFQVIYITNRKDHNWNDTYENLKKQKFPIEKKFLITRSKESSKETRRKNISKNYEIIMLIGDNLTDFSSAFEVHHLNERMEQVKNHKSDFGSKFIMLPNSMYGDWLQSFEAQNKVSKFEKHLITY